MRIVIDGAPADIWAVSYDAASNEVVLLDQRLLPHRVERFRAKDLEAVAFAIRDMVVRGAPAIGVAAGFGMAQAARAGVDLEKAAAVLRATRPTAHDLFFAVDSVLRAAKAGKDPAAAAQAYAEDTVDRCRRIGEAGASLIRPKDRILTHCNAGALATVDYGTALAPLRVAAREGKKPFVFVDETRPRLQGAKLTAWELLQEGIDHAIIADNAAGHFMARGEVDLVITGADRIAANGDTANKIGTYEKAVLAKENGIPFYVAAPRSTFDFSIADGNAITIEERADSEVRGTGADEVAPKGSPVRNPAFDVTPARYVTSFITEYGRFRPDQLGDLRAKAAEDRGAAGG